MSVVSSEWQLKPYSVPVLAGQCHTSKWSPLFWGCSPHMSFHMENVDVQQDLRLLWAFV